MHSDMFGSITLDLVLRIVCAGVMGIPLVVHVFRMNPDNPAADPSGLEIAGDMISDFESFFRFH